MAQTVKNLPAMQETRVPSLGQEDPLEVGMATHSSTLAWGTPWTEEPGGLQSVGSQRVGRAWVTHVHSPGVADARGQRHQGLVDGNSSQNGSEKASECQDLCGDGLGTPTELNGLAPGTPVGFPGVRCPYLHSMFRFGSRFRKVVSIPGVTEYYNLWRKQS